MSELGTSILKGLSEALEYAQGKTEGVRAHVFEPPARMDVRALRHRLGMTQKFFATQFGFSVQSVRNWEQGLRRPERAARLLLHLIAHEPEFVARALRAEDTGLNSLKSHLELPESTPSTQVLKEALSELRRRKRELERVEQHLERLQQHGERI